MLKVVVFLAGCALILTGCTQQGGNDKTDHSTGVSKYQFNPDIGPINSLYLNGTDYATFWVTHSNRVTHRQNKCMQDKGYAIKKPDESIDSAKIKAEINFIKYDSDLWNDADRVANGYGITGFLFSTNEGEAPDESYLGKVTENMSAAEKESFENDYLDCGIAATQELDSDGFKEWMLKEERDINAQIMASDEIISAKQNWVSCMNKAGYAQIKDMDDSHILELDEKARSIEPFSAEAKQLQQEELAMADQDWKCRETHYNKVYREVRDQKEMAFIEANPEVIEKGKKFTERILSGE